MINAQLIVEKGTKTKPTKNQTARKIIFELQLIIILDKYKQQIRNLLVTSCVHGTTFKMFSMCSKATPKTPQNTQIPGNFH